ncbi:hypothetical protein [Streptomyces sp. NPDC050848]|uniref:hypothetical protein n=1 Tax=Streptomyces sp. NPDC050848 TaxID=3155791 RepID=UPI0033C23589
MPSEFTLYVVAFVLELVGLFWTVSDILGARRRLLAYFRRPAYAYARDVAAAVEAYNITARTDPPPTVNDRIQALEEWRAGLPAELDRRDREVASHLETRLQGDLDATHQSIETQLRQVNEYLEGGLQEAHVSLVGPVVLLAGVIVGFLGNIRGLN